MVKILAVCGNGIGTSKLMKLKVSRFLKANDLEAEVTSCSLAESGDLVDNFEIILCSKHIMNHVQIPSGKHLISLHNLLDEKEFGPMIQELIKLHFS